MWTLTEWTLFVVFVVPIAVGILGIAAMCLLWIAMRIAAIPFRALTALRRPTS